MENKVGVEHKIKQRNDCFTLSTNIYDIIDYFQGVCLTHKSLIFNLHIKNASLKDKCMYKVL